MAVFVYKQNALWKEEGHMIMIIVCKEQNNTTLSCALVSVPSLFVFIEILMAAGRSLK